MPAQINCWNSAATEILGRPAPLCALSYCSDMVYERAARNVGQRYHQLHRFARARIEAKRHIELFSLPKLSIACRVACPRIPDFGTLLVWIAVGRRGCQTSAAPTAARRALAQLGRGTALLPGAAGSSRPRRDYPRVDCRPDPAFA
jgi:hypothetical protein